MFNYTRDFVINEDEKIKFSNDNTELQIKRAANYKVANILDKTIYVTKPVDGVDGSVTIKVPAVTDADVLRLTMFMATPDVELAEFGTPGWREFGKPFVVEIGAQSTAAKGAENLGKALKLAIGEYAGVKVAEDEVTITFKEYWMSPEDVKLEQVKFGETDETVTEVTTGVSTIASVMPKLTGEWMIENLRFPTAGNRRYAALNADETPIPGEKYYQIIFDYVSERSVPGGLSGIGQVVKSVTKHIFYVKEAAYNALSLDTKAPVAGLKVVKHPDNSEDHKTVSHPVVEDVKE